MEKIANALGAFLGLTTEILDTSNGGIPIQETHSETKNDTTFTEYKVTTNDIGAFNHSYKRAIGGGTTEVRNSTNRNEIKIAQPSNEEDNENY